MIRIHLLVLVAVSTVFAQSPEETFQRGNDLYREGNYRLAAGEYESVFQQGLVSAPLFFNLGNTYYRMGNTARAILFYERALRLEPGDDDIAFNLKLARLKTVDRIESVPELFLISWLRGAAGMMSLSTAATTFLLSWIILFLALTLFQVVNSWGAVLRWIILASLMVAIFSGSVLALQLSQIGERDEAVMMDAVVTAKTSPDAQGLDAFVIHSGLKVRVEDVVGDWTKIVLADGKVGWVRSSTFERI